jgi:hypothetical protein
MSIRRSFLALALIASVSDHASAQSPTWSQYPVRDGFADAPPWETRPTWEGRGAGVGENRNGRCKIFNFAKPSSLGHHHSGVGRGCS